MNNMQQGNMPGLVTAALVIGGIWLFTRSKNDQHILPRAVKPGGSLSTVGFAQGTGEKHPGDVALVSVQWNPNTRNAAGAPIAWPYRLVTRLYTTSRQLAVATRNLGTRPATGPLFDSDLLTVPSVAEIAPPYPIWVVVVLEAADPTPSGTPASTFTQVAASPVSNSLQVTSPAAGAVPGATLTSVTLSQRARVYHTMTRGGIRHIVHGQGPTLLELLTR